MLNGENVSLYQAVKMYLKCSFEKEAIGIVYGLLKISFILYFMIIEFFN